ncbi:MAG: sodium:proton antiporter [Lachnospiraceae bacterium]|nr:sodium:proton antiporter [Lachnospiraceae bacterium]
MVYHYLYITILLILSVMLFACLVRAVKGPRIADRLVSVNMMGTMVMVMIAILALMLDEGYLVDVCLVYAMISFLSVVVLSKVYIGIYEEKRFKSENPNAEDEGGMSDGSL